MLRKTLSRGSSVDAEQRRMRGAVGSSNLDITPDLDWDVRSVQNQWPRGPDDKYLLARVWLESVEATAHGAVGPILHVGCGDAMHTTKLGLRGIVGVGLDPSPQMLAQAAESVAVHKVPVHLVRGIAETLPFHDNSFDRVLCESAIDHFADPQLGMREMARVLRRDGRLIVGSVNYGSVTTRLSRIIYRLGRRFHFIRPHKHLFWDSPVPHEHTFECTYRELMRLASDWLDFDYAYGISLGWQLPAWGSLLSRLSKRHSDRILKRLDRLAYSRPALADYLITIWRPKAQPVLIASIPHTG